MLKRLTIVLAVTVVPTALSAADYYFGGALGDAIEGGSFRTGLENVSDSRGDRSRIFAGFRFGKYWAVEGSGYDFGDQTCCSNLADLGFESEVEGVSIAAIGRLPLKWFTPFLKVGALSWEEDGEFVTLVGPRPESADGTEFLWGGGIDALLFKHVGIRVEWESLEFDETSSDAVWLGAYFQF